VIEDLVDLLVVQEVLLAFLHPFQALQAQALFQVLLQVLVLLGDPLLADRCDARHQIEGHPVQQQVWLDTPNLPADKDLQGSQLAAEYSKVKHSLLLLQ
jgi:hypothetical protein